MEELKKKRGRPKGSTKKVNLEAKLIKELDVNPLKRKRGRPARVTSSQDETIYSGTLLEQAAKRGYKKGVTIQSLHDTMKGIIREEAIEIPYNGSKEMYLMVVVETSFDSDIPFFIFDPSVNSWAKIILAESLAD